MPRPRLLKTFLFPYHIRARSNNKEWFYLPKSICWDVFTKVIDKTTVLYHLHPHLFVLMDNHIHLIASTPDSNLGHAMQYLLREASKEMGRISGRINRIFGARYQRSLLDNHVYFRNAFKYVCRNPVASELTSKVEDYPFSTLNWTLKKTAPLFSISREPTWLFDSLPKGDEDLLTWLNEPYLSIHHELVKKGLRRQTCRWSTSARFRKWVGNI